MVAAATIDVSQVFILATNQYNAQDLLASQVFALTAAIWPADGVSVSQAHGLVAVAAANTITTSQAFVLAASTGRVADPNVRVWTYTLDGHDFVVFRLGNDETLVYDITTSQWSTFASGSGALWRAYNGTNWLGADPISAGYGSNIVVGDDGNGSLYFLDPDGDTDDDAIVGADTPRPFDRVAIGQVVTHGYNAQRCFGVTLLGSIGEQVSDDTDLRSVNLSVSDDSGHSYTDCGDLTVDAESYQTRLNWRSLGSVRYPGRLFKISDSGALKRIDSLDVQDER